MQRYFISEADYLANTISGDDAFHISRVMRNKTGDNVEVCYDGKGYLVELISIKDKVVNYKVVNELESKKHDYSLTLIQGMPKGSKIDDILMHGTELGCDHFILALTDWSQFKLDNDKKESKLIRYNKICKEASEQSHRFVSSDAIDFIKLNKYDYSQYDLKLLLDEEEAKKANPFTLKQCLKTNLDKKNIVFVIGPEGGISPKEREFLISEGFIPVSLMTNILRTETASLAVLSMITYEFEGK